MSGKHLFQRLWLACLDARCGDSLLIGPLFELFAHQLVALAVCLEKRDSKKDVRRCFGSHVERDRCLCVADLDLHFNLPLDMDL